MAITLIRAASPSSEEPRRKRFNREDYHWLREIGRLPTGKRYELIDGDIVEEMPQKEPHASLTMRWLFALARAFGESFVRCQMPTVASEYTEPEPDIMVTAQPGDVYLKSGNTPEATEVRLAVEISVSSLRYDTETKAHIYAQSGIPEYWVVDVAARVVIVHRDPTADGYTTVFNVAEDRTVSPLCKPEVLFKVSEYLP